MSATSPAAAATTASGASRSRLAAAQHQPHAGHPPRRSSSRPSCSLVASPASSTSTSDPRNSTTIRSAQREQLVEVLRDQQHARCRASRSARSCAWTYSAGADVQAAGRLAPRPAHAAAARGPGPAAPSACCRPRATQTGSAGAAADRRTARSAARRGARIRGAVQPAAAAERVEVLQDEVLLDAQRRHDAAPAVLGDPTERRRASRAATGRRR